MLNHSGTTVARPLQTVVLELILTHLPFYCCCCTPTAITVDLSAMMRDLGGQPLDDAKHTAHDTHSAIEHNSNDADDNKGESLYMQLPITVSVAYSSVLQHFKDCKLDVVKQFVYAKVIHTFQTILWW
jgi:hypothetical protein